MLSLTGVCRETNQADGTSCRYKRSDWLAETSMRTRADVWFVALAVTCAILVSLPGQAAEAQPPKRRGRVIRPSTTVDRRRATPHDGDVLRAWGRRTRTSESFRIGDRRSSHRSHPTAPRCDQSCSRSTVHRDGNTERSPIQSSMAPHRHRTRVGLGGNDRVGKRGCSTRLGPRHRRNRHSLRQHCLSIQCHHTDRGDRCRRRP